jgi:hypothetical protein
MVPLCNGLLQYAIYMYYGPMKSKYISLALPLDMHSLIELCLSRICSNIPNYVTISQIHDSNGTSLTGAVTICYLHVLQAYGKQIYYSCLATRHASTKFIVY